MESVNLKRICDHDLAQLAHHNVTVDRTMLEPACVHESYLVHQEFFSGILWLVTSVLVFYIPQPEAAERGWKNGIIASDLALSEDEEDAGVELKSPGSKSSEII
jgi:hypothetical protein